MDLSLLLDRSLNCTVTPAKNPRALASIVIESRHLARRPSRQAQAWKTRPPTALFQLTFIFSRARRIDPTCCINERLLLEDPCLPSFLGTSPLFETLQSGRLKPTFPRFSNLGAGHHTDPPSRHTFRIVKGDGSIRWRDTGENAGFTHRVTRRTVFPHNSWQPVAMSMDLSTQHPVTASKCHRDTAM